MKLGHILFGVLFLVGAGLATAAPITSVAICGPLSCTATVSAVPFLISTPQEFIWDFSSAPFVTDAANNPILSVQVAIKLSSIAPGANSVAHELQQGPGGTPYAVGLGGSSSGGTVAINLFPTYAAPTPQFANLTAEITANSGLVYTRFVADPTGTATLDSASVTVNFQPAGIPEPGSYLLIGTGLASLLVLRRRRPDQNS